MDTEPTNIEVLESDIKTEWFSGTGKGGQHRNKHQNSCRLLHVPTGIRSSAQCRSRQNSYNEAFQELCKRVKEHYQSSYYDTVCSDRKDKVGSGMRGDKIRTYRFQDNLVTDHKTNIKSSCSKVMEGNMDLLWV